MKGKIKYLSFGSPLMDVIADVPENFIVDNHIDLNSSVHISLKNCPFFAQFISCYNVTYVAGGCQFNAMRVFNWMMDKNPDEQVGFLGSMGDDNFSIIYEDLLLKENIVPFFQEVKGQSGICLVICNKRDRAHITDLGVSTKIDKQFVDRIWDQFKNVQLIYTELFILKSQPEITRKLAEFGSQTGRIYGFNLPSYFFLEAYSKEISELITFADIIFANKDEAEFFVKIMGKETDGSPKMNCEILAKWPKKNSQKKRVCVVTCGPDPAWCCEYDPNRNEVTYCESSYVKFVDKEKIVDTNGAGDSFSGGFLSQFMKGKSLKQCMVAGHWAAAIIIQQRGCQFPGAEIHFESKEEKNDEVINERLGVKDKNNDSTESDEN